MWHVTPLKDSDVELLKHLAPAAMALQEASPLDGVSFWWGDDLVGCGGVIEWPWPGVGCCWLILIAGRLQGLKRLRPALATMRSIMTDAMTRRGMWRLQAAVHGDWPPALKLAEALGGVCEGVMRRYGPDGVDYRLYSWVRKEEPCP